MQPPESSPLIVAKLESLAIEPNREELLRYLGYGKSLLASRTLPPAIECTLRDGQAYLQPRGTYAIYRVEHCGPRELTIGGVSIAGKVGTFLKGADRVATFVVTVGERITDASRTASAAGDIVTGWALDALGSWAAEAAVEALVLSMRSSLGSSDGMGARFSPGYCGMNLREQQTLFKLFDAETIGVKLLPSFLMQPMKSVSGLLGIGADPALAPAGVPCDRCDDVDCSMRRPNDHWRS
jgi:hypothetical protein